METTLRQSFEHFTSDKPHGPITNLVTMYSNF